MKLVNGVLYPNSDVACAPAMQHTIGDLEVVYPHVKRFDVVVQAGGNVGVFPGKLAERFKTVYTFEPDAKNFACLCRNVMAENVIKIQGALGESHSLIDLKRNPENVGAHYVDGKGTIPTFRIDDLALAQLDLLMLDVEGSEISAIRGGLNAIEAFRPCIVVEENRCQTRFGHAEGDLRRLLESLGYRVVTKAHRDVVYVC